MKNETTMTDKQAQALLATHAERAKVQVHLAANPDNPVVQLVGKAFLGCWTLAIARAERKYGLR